jgi:hypothetical protein
MRFDEPPPKTLSVRQDGLNFFVELLARFRVKIFASLAATIDLGFSL